MDDGGLDRSRGRHRVAGRPLSRARTTTGLAHGDVHRHRRLYGLRRHARRPGRGTPGPCARRRRATRDPPALGPHPEAPRRRAHGRVRVTRRGAPRRARDAAGGAGRASPHRHPRRCGALARGRSHRPRGERGRAHRGARGRRRDPGERRGARRGGRSRGALSPGAGARDRRPGAARALPRAGDDHVRRLPDGVEGTMYGERMTMTQSIRDSVQLAFRPPLDWPALLGFVALRATPGVEAVAAGVYRRTIAIGGDTGTIEVRAAAAEPHLLMRVRLGRHERLLQVVERARRLFDLDADPGLIGGHLARSPELAPLVARRPGLRVPGAWDAFELAVRAVLGQQVTVRGATTLAGRLVRAAGTPLDRAEDGLTHLFPRPEALAHAELASIGVPRARAATIRALAGAVASGEVVLDASRWLEDAVARLAAVPGIGAWTAHYVAMRALGEPDAFPAADLGLRRALGNGAGRLAPARVAERAEAWRPWRAYAVMHLWAGLAGEEDT